MFDGAAVLFEAVLLLFSWLPAPLNVMATGVVSLVVVVAIVRLIAFLWELLPFT